MKIIEVPIEKIKFDKNQPRQTLNHDKIVEMAQSIKTEGVINPIEIDSDYKIITGELRFRASKLAGLKVVPCKMLTNLKYRYRRQVIENLHNNTMSDWDTAVALKKLLDGDGRQGSIRSSKQHKGGNPDQGIRELGRIIGKGQTFILEKLSLLEASKPFQKAVQKGLPASFIRAIKMAPVPYQKELENKIIKGDFRNREEAIEVAKALKRTPEKAVEILEAPNLPTMYKISPRLSDVVEEKLKVATEFLQIKKELLDWLENNPAHTIINKDRLLIILSMTSIVNKLNEWATHANQPKFIERK